jgi:hypothetical protein
VLAEIPDLFLRKSFLKNFLVPENFDSDSSFSGVSGEDLPSAALSAPVFEQEAESSEPDFGGADGSNEPAEADEGPGCECPPETEALSGVNSGMFSPSSFRSIRSSSLVNEKC